MQCLLSHGVQEPNIVTTEVICLFFKREREKQVIERIEPKWLNEL